MLNMRQSGKLYVQFSSVQFSSVVFIPDQWHGRVGFPSLTACEPLERQQGKGGRLVGTGVSVPHL